MKADESITKCSNCKHVITETEYLTEFEDRGTFCKEEIVTGYKCKVCGYEEDF